MKRIGLSVALSMVVLLAPALESAATQVAVRRAGGQGWGAKTLYGSLFDPATVESFHGEVLDVEVFTPLRQMGWGLLVTVKTKDGVVPVHIGPGWFLDDIQLKILPGDKVQVRGSRIKFDEKPAVIATEVTVGEKRFILRRDDGLPVWSEDDEAS
jgi:hypothetical protein